MSVCVVRARALAATRAGKLEGGRERSALARRHAPGSLTATYNNRADVTKETTTSTQRTKLVIKRPPYVVRARTHRVRTAVVPPSVGQGSHSHSLAP